MKRSLLIITLIGFAFMQCIAQSATYGDVAVIVNDSSAGSVAIGNYFAQQRGISPNRILHITAPTTTDIDSVQFQDMRAQIEAALITGNLLDTVNYLVTTRGIPARVNIRRGCDTISPVSFTAIERCTCTESELSLILGPSAGDILQTTHVVNPYRVATSHFDRDSFGIFLLSRLDGYTDQDAQALVDHGGPNHTFSKNNAQIVADASGWPSGVGNGSYFQMTSHDIATAMNNKGYQTLTDTSALDYIPRANQVIGYSGIHTEIPGVAAAIEMDFLPGSSAHLWIDYKPITSRDSTRYTAGDAIAQGAGVVTTLVGLGFMGPNILPNIFLDIYADTSADRYNAAEAFYRSTSVLSAQSILYGDPKTSIIPSLIMSTPDPQVLDFAMFPNPTQGLFTIRLKSGAARDCQVQITDLQGKSLLTATHKGDAAIEVDARTLPAGLYIVRVQQGESSFARKLSVVH